MGLQTTSLKLLPVVVTLLSIYACGGRENAPNLIPNPISPPTAEPIPECNFCDPLTGVRVEAEESNLITDPENDRAEQLGSGFNEPVQFSQLGDGEIYAVWIILPLDGVEFNAPISAIGLTLGYATGSNIGSIAIKKAGADIGEFSLRANFQADWFTPITGSIREVSTPLLETIEAGDKITLEIGSTGVGANINYLIFHP